MKTFEVKRKFSICNCQRSSCICDESINLVTKYGVSFVIDGVKKSKEFWTESARKEFIDKELNN